MEPTRIPAPIAPEQLRWHCDPDSLGFEDVREIECVPGIIGQDRAIEALELGIHMRNKGYNVFVTGAAGSGRTTTVKHVLETTESGRGAPPDIVFVNNFQDSDRPRPIHLRRGQGRAFADDMRDFVEQLKVALTQVYQTEKYKDRRKAVVDLHQEEEKVAIQDLEKEVKEKNFVLIQVQIGPYTKPEVAPLIAGEPKQMEQLEGLVAQGQFDAEELERLHEVYTSLKSRLEETFRRSKEVQKRLKKALQQLESEFARPIVADSLDDIKTTYENPDIDRHLDGAGEFLLTHLKGFLEDKSEEEGPDVSIENDERYRPFLVNVLVDNSDVESAPVIVETSPNYRNLFGTIEKVVDRTGHWRSDFLHIKAGSVLRANGGFLVIQLNDALSESGVWAALKRTMKNRQIDIQAFDPMFLLSTSAVKPEPIDVDIRIIVIGNGYLHHALSSYDPDFYNIFKVKADFDYVMPRSEETIQRYSTFIRNVIDSENLPTLDKTGVARVVDYGARLSGQARKISTLFSEIADILRESAYWSKKEGSEVITDKVVSRAIFEKERRVSLSEEKVHELIIDGTIRVETSGTAIGQVNGLSVYDLGDHRFGKPSRITSQTSLGQGGIISIEREVDLSGRSFNKAILILDGLFRARFGQEQPVSVHATIAFEQSYGEVDGDSASVAEACALLSSISDVPLRQDLAITGSIDQHGVVQPIGGANEKIEGFFDVCRSRGLTGTQGVLIPNTNVADLMLREDVVAVAREGQFHVYPIETLEEALELMTGLGTGERGEDGTFPEGSLFARVEGKLSLYSDRMKEHGKTDSEETDSDSSNDTTASGDSEPDPPEGPRDEPA